MAVTSPLPMANNASMDPDNEKRTIFVGNLPRNVAKREIEDLFGDIGPIKRCYIQYPRGEKKQQDTTVAYVTYAISDDAAAALEKFSNKKIGGNKINLKLSTSRSEQAREFQGVRAPKPPPPGSVNAIPVTEQPKVPRPKPVNKKSRLIIRNLSFQMTEEKLTKYFSKCGEIKDVNILRKPNGKMVGCAFIQYANVHQAIEAIKELNFKEIMGRPIAVDWAMAKKEFQKVDTETSEETIKEENEEDSDMKVKVEPEDEVMDVDLSIVKEEDEDSDENPRKRSRKIKSEGDFDNEAPRKKVKRNDVEEGKTLFIRNLEFETTEVEVKEFFETFGPLEYALVCKDKLTEHPKGTAFVKFKEGTAANECLQKVNYEPTYFKLGRRQFYVSLAMSKERIEEKGNEDKSSKEDIKDKRNLYLAREGFIRPGSEGAEGVSPTDMNQRATLNKTKKQMLNNLNIFVSPNRLCVHNLSPNFGDQDLRKLFLKHSVPDAKITEAKIMRDLKDTDLNGVGKSKGFGFVTFTQHEHALQALRKLNNNPTIFSKTKRPIVEFSLENRAAVKAKQKRTEKSIENNVEAQQQQSEKKMNRKEKRRAKRAAKIANKTEDAAVETESDSQNKQPENEEAAEADADEDTIPPKKTKKTKNKKNKDTEKAIPKFSGLTAKEGISKIPLMKPKGKITRKSLKPSKKNKKIDERRMREPKSRPKNKEKEDAVDRIVSRYKQQQGGDDVKVKQKWYS